MKILIALFFCTFSSICIAQDEYETDKKPKKPKVETEDPKKEERKAKAYEGMSSFKRNIRIGGAFNIGSYFENALNKTLFAFQISPQITYMLSDHFEGGISTSYAYLGSFDEVNVHGISAGPILRAYPIEEIFLQVEGVGFYNSTSVKGYIPSTSFNVNAFIGGGYVSRFSETSYMLTGIKVNLMKNELTYNQILPTIFTSIHFGLW